MSRPSPTSALGIAFQVCRSLQFACLIATIGLSARLISTLVDHTQQPPAPLITTLCITCFAVLYVIITYALYFDNKLPQHLAVGTDALILTALSVASVIVGKPLSHISCKTASAAAAAIVFDPTKTFAEAHPTTTTSAATTTMTPVDTAWSYLTPESGTVPHLSTRSLGYYGMHAVDYEAWVGSAGDTCTMMKAVWGLVVALMVLFVLSMVCLAFLWKREKTPRGADVVEGKEYDGGYV